MSIVAPSFASRSIPRTPSIFRPQALPPAGGQGSRPRSHPRVLCLSSCKRTEIQQGSRRRIHEKQHWLAPHGDFDDRQRVAMFQGDLLRSHRERHRRKKKRQPQPGELAVETVNSHNHTSHPVKPIIKYERSCYLFPCVTIFSCPPSPAPLASRALRAPRLAVCALAKPSSPAPWISPPCTALAASPSVPSPLSCA